MRRNQVHKTHVQDSDLVGSEATLRKAVQYAKENKNSLKVVVYSEKEAKTECYKYKTTLQQSEWISPHRVIELFSHLLNGGARG